MTKLKVGLLFGGRSCEHEVSVSSARSVLEAIDKEKYEVTLIGIDKQGRWLLPEKHQQSLENKQVDATDMLPVMLDYPGDGGLVAASDESHAAINKQLDVVVPILHGPYGEDGTIQGLLELADVAYVGAGVLGSAVGMDKVMARRVFKAEGIPQVDYAVLRSRQWQQDASRALQTVLQSLQFPLFVKPANMGSSVGVSKAENRDDLINAVNLAFNFDDKVLIEAEAKNCREVECAVLGNHEPRASVVGEIVSNAGFYDYDTKYVDDCSELIIPADLPDMISERVRALAIRVFQTVEAWGLSRVDFFVDRDSGEIYINEINTMPGFTPISMYPKLWQASGIAYADLIDQLIELAMQRHQEKQSRRTSL